MTDEARIIPGSEGTWRTEVVESAEDKRRKRGLRELLGHGERGFSAFVRDDFDWSHSPWLVLSADRSVWVQAHGEPGGGRSPDAYALLVNPDNSYTWLVRATHSGHENAPRDADELAARVAAGEARKQRAAREADEARERARKAARPVTIADVEPDLRGLTIASAAAAVEHAGGVEVRKDRLVISLDARQITPTNLRAVRFLYLAEAEVVATLKAKRRLPDKEVTPAGAIV